MRTKPFRYSTAALFALLIAVLMHLFFLIIFIFGKDAVFPDGATHMRPPRELDWYRLGISFLSNFALAFTLFAVNFAIQRSRAKHKTALAIVCTLIATVAISSLSEYIQFSLFHDPEKIYRLKKMIRGGLFRDSMIAIIVLLSTEIMRLSHKKQQIAIENEALMAENVRSRYEALKNQVDPHFLFNTLNTLNSLIKIDTDKAQEYVQKLSSVFRYTLQHREVNTLDEELKFTSDYCALMRLRYGDSLSFRFDIDSRYGNYHVVPLSVQTLIENAVKHNVITQRMPLTVTISTTPEATLIVSNPIQEKKEPGSSEGIGLANLSERYRLKWQREIEVRRCGNRFEVVLPLIKPENKG